MKIITNTKKEMDREMSRSKGFIGAIVMLVTIILAPTIRTSTAQESVSDDCWAKIVECSENSGGILQCCPLIQEAISDERLCFCTIKDVVRDNATLASNLATLLISCGESAPLDTLCPDGSGVAPTPSGNLLPSPPGSDSSLTPLPSPTSTNLSPTETPASSPTAEEEDLEESTNCMGRIRDCINATLSTPDVFVSECCPLIKQEIANERECFCGFKELVRQKPSSNAAFSQLFFKTCSIPGSFDTLCPEGPPLSPSETVSFPPSDEDSPTSPTVDTMFPPPPADTISNNDNESGSSKISVSVVLLLLINMIILCNS